jgi:hypothetical protein
MVVTEINGVKGFLDLNCRFYPIDIMRDACNRFEKEHPEFSPKGKRFTLFDLLLPEADFSKDPGWRDVVNIIQDRK